jgi:O-antigen/teichoic acid export membrane protein
VVRLAAIASAIFLFPFIANRVGLADYGIWLLLSAVTLFFLSADFGMGTSAVRYVAAAHARDDGVELGRVVSSSVAFFAVLGVAVSLVLVGLMALLWPSLNIPDPDRDEAIAMLAVVCVGNFLIGLPLNVFRFVLAGVQRYDMANLVALAQVVLRVTLVVAVLLAGAGIVAVAVVESGAFVLASLLALALTRRLVPGLQLSARLVSPALLRSMAPYSLQVFVIGVAALVILQADNLIIGVALPVGMVTLYAAAYRVYQVCRDVTGSLLGPLVPDAAAASVRGQEQRLRSLFLLGTKYANALMLLLVVPALVFAEPLLVLWAGEEFAEAALPLQILALSLLLNNNHLVALALLMGRGTVGAYARYHAVWALANVAISIALVGPYELEGVALGTALPLLVLEPLYVRTALRELGVPLRAFARDALLAPYGAALAALVPLAAIQSIWSPRDLGGVLLAAAVYCAAFVAVFGARAVGAGERARLLALLRRGSPAPA